MKRLNGALKVAARDVRDAGRFGDQHVVHVNDRELAEMEDAWGSPTVNPDTGLPEFFDLGGILGAVSGVLGPVGQIAQAALPIASMIMGSYGSQAGMPAGAMGQVIPQRQRYGQDTADPDSYVTGTPTPSGDTGLGGWFNRNSGTIMPLLGGLGMGLLDKFFAPDIPSPAKQLAQLQAAVSANNPEWNKPLQKQQYHQDAVFDPNTDWTHYGESAGTHDFFPGEDNQGFTPKAAEGGIMQMRSAGRMYKGPGGGQDDKIPAYLSNGEYVIDATTVSDLGDGDPETGAAKLDQFRSAIARQKGRKRKVPPKAHSSALAYMGAR